MHRYKENHDPPAPILRWPPAPLPEPEEKPLDRVRQPRPSVRVWSVRNVEHKTGTQSVHLRMGAP